MRRILLLNDSELNRVVLKEDLRAEMFPLLQKSCAVMLGESDKAVQLLGQLS